MTEPRATTFYVYSLKDPRQNPALPFYIGKGTGDRARQHLQSSGRSRKDEVIAEIKSAGRQPLVDILVSDLNETDALRIEAELIAAFGTENTGGVLTNVVSPTGRPSTRKDISIPSGAFERAQLGLGLLLEAIYSLAEANEGDGISNADAVHALDLGSDNGGAAKDYLTYSILGILMREKRLIKGSDSRYRVPGFGTVSQLDQVN